MKKLKVLYINSVLGFGSTGNIVEDLASCGDIDGLACFGRKKYEGKANAYQFSSFSDNASAALETIFLDNNIDVCKVSTEKLINKIKEYNPDIIHLHNIHGYYVNFIRLLSFLNEFGKPVVWTLHDCWPITGYCPHFDYLKCDRYQTQCKNCPYPFAYPFSIFKQKVEYEYQKKNELINSLNDLHIVAISNWQKDILKKSFLKDKDISIVYDGINLEEFKPTIKKNDKFTVIAVASYWNKEKGINEIEKILPLLDKDVNVVVVGAGSDKLRNCKSIKRTANRQELAGLYSDAHVLINPTMQEAFGLVNVEALACGTPVVTYNTGGSPEIIDSKTGVVIEKGNYVEMANVINNLKNNYDFHENDCIDRSKMFSKEKMISTYMNLYRKITREN